jgi:hypothetical protein
MPTLGFTLLIFGLGLMAGAAVHAMYKKSNP